MDAADILFGEIAVSGGYLTHEQLVECLMTQSRRPSKRIGELARELGFIDDAQLAEILSEQKDRGIAPPPKRRAPDVDRSRRRMSPSMEVLLNDYVDDPSAASPLPPSRAAEVDGAVRKLARERRRDSSSPRAVPPARGNASLDALLEGYMDDAAASDPANDPRSDAASRLTEDVPHVPRSEALHAAEPARAHEPAHASTRAAKPPPPKAPPVAGTPKGPPPAALPAGT
ncbi:MAG: hypothetical protein KC503_41515, partial [Myxococcales bacterium]|nr:hypothetical protein [Myxococcales bacterium]